MNCHNCKYKGMVDPLDNSHCYMFREQPRGRCLQFKGKQSLLELTADDTTRRLISSIKPSEIENPWLRMAFTMTGRI